MQLLCHGNSIYGNFEGLGGFVHCVFAHVGTSKNSFKVQEEKGRDRHVFEKDSKFDVICIKWYIKQIAQTSSTQVHSGLAYYVFNVYLQPVIRALLYFSDPF